MQYSLPISINHRREIFAEFVEQQPNSTNNFVIEITDTNLTDIITVSTANTITCFVENAYDISMQHVQVQADLQNNHCIVQLIVANNIAPIITEEVVNKKEHFYDDLLNATKPKPAEKTVDGPTLSNSVIELGNINTTTALQLTTSNNTIAIAALHRSNITQQLFSNNTLHLTLELHVDNKIYYFSTNIWLVHPSQYLGIALDFGSESSQMATKRFEIGEVVIEDKPNTENLFQQIKLFYTNNKWLANNEQASNNSSYYQEEKGSNFYKSLFFLKEHLTDNYENIDACDFIKSQHNNLELLIDMNSMQKLVQSKYHQLPNLKIIHQHDDILSNIGFEFNDADDNVIPLTLKEIKQKVNNTILKTMIESFLQKEFLRHKTATRFIRMQLLVPNIYSSANILNTKLQLNKIFAELAISSTYSGKLLGWEVQTISESDAAFIGYSSKKNSVIQPNKDYVIIDVGKGTTDFSVLKTGEKNIFDLKPIYRNGFAGAGNLITNAIFETVIKYIREASVGQSGVTKFINDKILDSLSGDDLVRCRKFYEEIERLKFNFKTEHIDAVFANFATAEKLGNTLGNAASKDVEFQTIIDILGQIDNGADLFGYVNDVCEAITTKVVAHLQMIQTNKKDFSVAGVILTGRGFLFAPLATMMKQKLQQLQINADKIILLSGNELKDICIKGVFNKAIHINTDLVGHPIQIIKNNIKKETTTTKMVAKKWYQLLVGSIENDDDSAKIILSNTDELQQNGLQHSEIIVGATAYTFGNKQIAEETISPSIASIHYSSSGFKVRKTSNGKVQKILPLSVIHDYDDVELRLVIPSLFPNYISKQQLRSLQDELIGLPNTIVAKPTETTTTGFNPLLFDTPASPMVTSPNTNDLLF
jgi:hypothetical protein